MPKLNFNHVYYLDGSEDLEGSYNQAVYNVRVLVEQHDMDYLDAAELVAKKMTLTFQEYKRLADEAQSHYEKEKDNAV